jgi:hypothetical protein
MSRANAGFIGLGDQGAPMAEAHIGAHSLYLWARRPEAVQPFRPNRGARHGHGAGRCPQGRGAVPLLARRRATNILQFDRGLANKLPHGATVINHATVDRRSGSSSTPSAGILSRKNHPLLGRAAGWEDLAFRSGATDGTVGIFGMLSMLTSAPSFQFNPLSLMNGNKGASASNLGHVDVIHLRSDTRSDGSGLWRPSDSAPPTTKV